MEHIDPCVICNRGNATTTDEHGADGIKQSCNSCGNFRLSRTALNIWQNKKREGVNIRKLGGWISEQNRLSSIPNISSDKLKSILSIPIPNINERAYIILLECYKDTDLLGKLYKFDKEKLLSATYSINDTELQYLLDYLESEKHIIKNLQNSSFNIQPSGYKILEQLKNPTNITSKFAFIAMSFDKELKHVFTDGISVAIVDAGFKPFRVDHEEYVGRIDDEILAGIQKSRFIVADFTGHKAGVYFEAGFAMGLGIPIVWTCRDDSINHLHFDIRQYNCIVWDNITSLKKKLYNRVTALM